MGSAVKHPTAGRLLAAGYREWLPPAGLRGALTCFWVSVVPPDAAPSVTAVMPDGCVDLIWQNGHGAFVAGPDTGPCPVTDPPGTVYVGARFRPGAGGPALGVPLARLRDQRVDLADLLPALAGRLPAGLPPQIALLTTIRLAAELVTAGPPDPLVVQATSLLARGRSNVAELGRELAVSERQLRRRFDDAVGYGPKMMHRVLRFRQVVHQLSAGRRAVDLASLAAQAGYADQAHLTRETTQLAGLPPAALARTFAAPLTSLTAARVSSQLLTEIVSSTTYRKSGAAVPTATWIVQLDGGQVGFWTSSASGKFKRLRNNSRIALQPADSRGKVKPGTSPVDGSAELITSGPVFDSLRAKVRAKYGFMVQISSFFNIIGHLGKGRFPYGDVAVVVTLSGQDGAA